MTEPHQHRAAPPAGAASPALASGGRPAGSSKPKPSPPPNPAVIQADRTPDPKLTGRYQAAERKVDTAAVLGLMTTGAQADLLEEAKESGQIDVGIAGGFPAMDALRNHHPPGDYVTCVDTFVDFLRRRIEVTQDPDEQIELYFRRGAIFSDALADLHQSLACYTAILEQESRNRRALESQERIFFVREEWQKLHDTYAKLVDVADGDPEMADIYARMAKISSEALKQEDQAIELWGRVLALRAVLGFPAERIFRLSIDPASITMLEWVDGEPLVHGLNRQP